VVFSSAGNISHPADLEIGDTAGLETCATGQGDIFIEQRAENSLREKQRCRRKKK
jgi:hypothetical protein